MTSAQLEFERRGQVPRKVAVPESVTIGGRADAAVLPLLLPVEITSRELDAKIFLACSLPSAVMTSLSAATSR